MSSEGPQKIAVVTGAGSGIGKSVAQALLAVGYGVALAGRKAETLENTVRESGRPASQVLVVPTDVTNPAAVRHLFASVREKFGRLDLLFNNAGISSPSMPLEDVPYERWREILDTNLTGAFLCTQEAFRLMKDQQPRGGRIINNGSISSHVPRPSAAPYNAAKFGISGLTKSTALDGRAFNIACGQIDIGNADTAMGEKMKKGVMQANGGIAIEPTFAVKHVVDAVLYMAGLPLDVNVPAMTVMATQMPYAGRG